MSTGRPLGGRPWAKGAVLLALGVLWLACRPVAEPAPSSYLWSDDLVSVQVQEGWVQGVPLEAPRQLPVVEDGGRTYFRAVAWSPDGDGTLRIVQEAGDQSLSLEKPRSIEIDLGAAATLHGEGSVALLWPRLVDPRRQGELTLLVVADTLRFDHANGQTMPATDAYFADGHRYTRAYSAASWTLPSMAALFTGQAPPRLRHPDGALIAIPQGQDTLASKLRRQGMATVGITANYTINHENGFSAGFESFLAPTPEGHSGDFRDASWVARWAREHAAWLPDLDLFLYLQFMDPHDPYRDHENGGQWQAPQTGHEPDPQEVEELRLAYASEVRYLDRQLAPLLRDLDAERVVFTSDHGEEFFDHGGFRHGPALYPESVHVPLWLRGPGIEMGQTAQPVSLIDLHPYLAGEVDSLDGLASPVTMETFSFGPPRWSWVDASRQWILMARPLVPPVEKSPVGDWLAEHHPTLQVLDVGTVPPTVAPMPTGSEARRLPQQLLDHFAGFRRGIFLQVPTGGSQSIELHGIEGDGWAWGAGEASLAILASGGWSLTVEAADPFLLVFLPIADDASPRVVDPSGNEHALVEEAAELKGGLRAWLDEGRSLESLRSSSETLERLKALGYI